jgi:tetratricopeptide (TPR) repeat protein
VKTPLKLSNIDRVAVAQEFHISVTPLGTDEYLVRIERVAPGVSLAEEQVSWPVEDWIAQARQLMNDPLLGVLEGSAAVKQVENNFFLPEWEEPVSPSARNLVELGQQLYNALFQGSLRDSWMMAQAIAQNQRQVLRLRLGLKGTRLPRLPWEVLHAGDRPLATGTDVAFSRYQLSTGLMRSIHALPRHPDQPLRILMVIAGPSDQETLELAQEASHLQEELKSRTPDEPPAIQLTILEQPGREQLTQALEQGHYQVFHYSGHSNLGDSGGDVYLVSNKTGLTETLNGDDLAGLLVNNGVQLAVFNSCRGAYTAASSPSENGRDRNLAEAMVKRGIPSVLAMAERIPDEVALTLTRLLYRNLNQGYPIDLSLSRARQGLIAAYGSNQLYWALPVLYLHPEFDGFLTNPGSAQTLSALLALPEPLDPSLNSGQREALFTPPRPALPFFPEDEYELDLALEPEFPEYDEELSDMMEGLAPDDPEAEDTSDFIKNLLNQIAPDPANGTPGRPGSNLDDGVRSSDAIDVQRPANLANSTPSPPQESVRTISTAGTPQALSQSERSVNSSNAVAKPKPNHASAGRRKRRGIPRLWIVLGATGAIAIALLGFWVFQNRGPRPDELLSKSRVDQLPQASSSSQNLDLPTADTSRVTSNAIEQLTRGNVAQGQKAVEVLLDRGALQQADAALAVVPKSQLDNPSISFLKGRLAWQSVRTGSKDYEVSDARRYWEIAYKGNRKSASYLTALGFAYYAEGNYERANNAWFDALTLTQKTEETSDTTRNTANKEELTIYAGLALGLQQSGQKQPPDQRKRFLSESLKLRQKVLSDDPVGFQPEALSKNWLWSEKAIQDWRSLLTSGK